MNKRFMKTAISLIMVLILISSSILSAFAYSIQSSTVFGNVIYNESESIDVTKIKLNVFRLELVKDDEVSSDYAHIYETSVFPDVNGSVKINRPSELCYIEVDMDSLPLGFGVDKNGVLIGANENEFEITVSEISDFKVDFSNDNVEFFNEDKTSLFVNQEYELDYDNNIEQIFLNQTKNQARTISENENVSVECSFEDFSVESQQSIDELSTIDKIDFLHTKGLITEEEKINYYVEGLKNGEIDDHVEVTNAFSTISSYSVDNELTEEMDESITNLVSDYIPTYENEAVYTDEYFAVHYENGDVSTRNIDLTLNYLNYAKTSLCSTFLFETPELAPGETRYQVYLVEGVDDYSGLTVPFTNGDERYSFIIIYYEDGQVEFNNRRYGTICHEFTHAVQFQYDATEFDSIFRIMGNFNEAVANAVAVRLVPNFGVGFFVNKFQNTPEYSLFKSHPIEAEANDDYYRREYGALLFPLYLMQEYSSLNTIRQIYEEYRLTNDLYEALDNVLQRSNSSLEQAYATCALFNYNLEHYYDYYQSGWKKTPRLDTINTDSLPYTSQYLSSRYFEITESSYNGFAITFDNVKYLDYAKLQRIDVVGSEFSNSNYSLFTESVTTMFNIEPGNKTCFILSNVGLSVTIKYSVRVFSD